MKGEVVGVNTLSFQPLGGENVGFAVSAEDVAQSLADCPQVVLALATLDESYKSLYKRQGNDDDLGLGGMRKWTRRDGTSFEAKLLGFDTGTVVYHRTGGVVYVNDERYIQLPKNEKTLLDAILKANGVHDLQKAAIEARGRPRPISYPIAVFSYKADNAVREFPIQLLIEEDYTPLLLIYRAWHKRHPSAGTATP